MPSSGSVLNRILSESSLSIILCTGHHVAMVLATIGESKVKCLIKVLEILESKDRSKVNKIEGENRRIVLVIHPWGPRIKGILQNILELSCVVVIWSHWTYKACIRIRNKRV